MEKLNFIKLKKVTITQGENVKIINNSKALDDFMVKTMNVTCIVTRNCVVRLNRLSNEKIRMIEKKSVTTSDKIKSATKKIQTPKKKIENPQKKNVDSHASGLDTKSQTTCTAELISSAVSLIPLQVVCTPKKRT